MQYLSYTRYAAYILPKSGGLIQGSKTLFLGKSITKKYHSKSHLDNWFSLEHIAANIPIDYTFSPRAFNTSI